MHYTMTKTEIKQNKLDMVEWLVSRPTWGESWRKYYTSKLITAARLTGGELVEVEKKHMETSFCFGYGMNGCDFENEQPDAMRAARDARNNFKFFLRENLEGIKEELKWLRSRLRNLRFFGEVPYLVVITTPNQTYIQDINRNSSYCNCHSEEQALRYAGEGAALRKLTEEDIRILIAAQKVRLEDIAKRCKTYWKRFGGSKLRTWSYLRD